MTALTKYQRLECPGLWRAAPEEQRRDVAVSLGETSLVLVDSRSGVPLAHWSLPAVRRRNPGEAPAIFSPDPDAVESLELDDREMIEALEAVQRSLHDRRQSGIRLRLVITGGILALLVGLTLFWLPEALLRHAVSVLPQPKRAEIGAAIMTDLARNEWVICGAPPGLRALARLQERVVGAGGPQLAVLAGSDAPDAVALPGGIILLGQSMIESGDTPDVAAGHVLAAQLTAQESDPLYAALKAAGLRSTLILLTTGDLPETALRGYGIARLSAPAPRPDQDTLLSRFETAQIASTPYAYAVDPTGETTLRLIEADPFRAASPPRPILSDGDWVSLQGICAG
jgi:hypothetical protein